MEYLGIEDVTEYEGEKGETDLDIYMRTLSIVESEDVLRGFKEDGELIGCYCKVTENKGKQTRLVYRKKEFIPILGRSIWIYRYKIDENVDNINDYEEWWVKQDDRRFADDITDAAEHCNSYWTQSGDTPVTDDVAFLNDQRDRNVEELLPPEKYFYSQAKGREYKTQHRNYLQWQYLLFKYSNSKSSLHRLWRGFWLAYFKRTPEQRKNWLCPWHIKNIVGVFKTHNITRKNK